MDHEVKANRSTFMATGQASAKILGSEHHNRYAVAWPDEFGISSMMHDGSDENCNGKLEGAVMESCIYAPDSV